MASPASRAVGSSSQHWYTDFVTSGGVNLIATSTFSTGRLLRVHEGLRAGLWPPEGEQGRGQLSESDTRGRQGGSRGVFT